MSQRTSFYSHEPVAQSEDEAPIDAFRGEFAFLSNFFEHPIPVEGEVYPTTEHAFQAMKTRETTERYTVRTAPTPAAAKSRGRRVTLREDWDTARFTVMEQLLRAKFADPELRRRLLATGDRTLIEGNTWRDTTWGAIRDKEGNWKGRNELGRLLMRLRDEMRAAESNSPAAESSGTEMTPSQRDELIQTALQARGKAYAPYSHYSVGAAVLIDDGRIFPGCNVENASYGLCNCAERTAIFSAVCAGARTVTAVAVATDDGGSPCGACRQVISEFVPKSGAAVPVLLLDKAGTVARETTLQELLPFAFSASSLNE